MEPAGGVEPPPHHYQVSIHNFKQLQLASDLCSLKLRRCVLLPRVSSTVVVSLSLRLLVLPPDVFDSQYVFGPLLDLRLVCAYALVYVHPFTKE